MLAVRQRQVSGKGMRVFSRGNHHSVEVIRSIKDASKIGEPFGLGVTLGCGVQRSVVHVTENGDILIWMRSAGRFGLPIAIASGSAGHDCKLCQARGGAAARGNERNV